MRRFATILGLLLLLIIGGGLTTRLIASRDTGIMPVLRQTDNADASISDMVPWKAEQLFLAIGFVLFNLVGMAVTLAVVVWFLDRGLRRSQAEAQGGTLAQAESGATPASRATSEPGEA